MKKVILVGIFSVCLLTSDTYAQFGKIGIPNLKKEIEQAHKKAEDLAKKAKSEKEKEEERRKAAQENERIQAERRKEEAKLEAEKEKLRLNNLEAEKLKQEAATLIQKNSELNVELSKGKVQLAELKKQLDAEQSQLTIEKEKHKETVTAFIGEKQVLETEKGDLEDKKFLFELGFWASIFAIAIGVVSAVIRYPVLRLEREKLKLEVELLKKQLMENSDQPASNDTKTLALTVNPN